MLPGPAASSQEIRAVIFDWGDTLMRVLPQFDGPMIHWPRLEMIPGVRRALAGLQNRYILAVGSNAGPSDAQTMALAFERVSIRHYFDYLFTHVELEVLKPDPRFFEGLTRAMGLAPERCLMIGDDYEADIKGAKGAGLKAILYAPDNVAPSDRPLADGIIRSLADAPQAVEAVFGGNEHR